MNNEITEKIVKGEIDVNSQEIFFRTLLKGFLYHTRNLIKVRGIYVPHFILNTGDDIMYLERKGQDHSIEPQQVSNEDFIYNQVPRAIVAPKGINIKKEELTNPFSRGQFVLDTNDELLTYDAEFRRIPLTMSVDIVYYLDSYTDTLECTQSIITNCAFNNFFKIIYMGQDIPCSYFLEGSLDNEYNVEIDGETTDSKLRKISISYEIETCFPIFRPKTVAPTDLRIANLEHGLKVVTSQEEKRIIE